MKRTLHIICGTHWDREWRYSYEQSLIRLAHVIDSVIEILEQDSIMKSYHLDGGTVMLEDYAAVRPEMTGRLKKLMKQKRIVTSPWYTLPEMFSVSGESIVRNMMTGQRVSEQFGYTMKTGYTPTGYGQLSQLPQLYAGFGIKDIFFYRGINKYEVPPLFWWKSPDSTRALDFRLFDDFARSNFYHRVYRVLLAGRHPGEGKHDIQPGRLFHPAGEESFRDGYRLLDALPCAYSDADIREAIDDMCTDAEQNMLVPGHHIAMHQEDNAVPSVHLVELLERIEKTCPDTEVRAESLADYVDFVRSSLTEETIEKLPVLKGEMRYSDVDGFWGGLNASAVSCRIYLKVANEAAENMLQKKAEPLCTLSWLSGADYPEERLESAWKSLLENHAHDSINGCSMDQVHKDMLYRFDKANLIARELASQAGARLTKDITHPLAEKGDFLIGVINTTAWEHSGTVTCCIDIPGDTGSARFEIIDADGNPVEFQTERIGPVNNYVSSTVVSGLRFESRRHNVSFEADSVPAAGWRTYLIRPLETPFSPDEFYTNMKRDFSTQMSGPSSMENEYLHVKVNENGTFDLTDKQTGMRYSSMNYFEESGDIGHPVCYCAPAGDEVYTSLGENARITVEEDGAFRTAIRSDINMRVPSEAELDGSGRSADLVDLPVTSRFTLRRGARFLEIRTRLDNRARDHRIRAVFPTGIEEASCSTAAIPFDVVERPVTARDARGWKEGYYPTHPMGSFVDISDGSRGLAVFSQGLKEYELIDNPSRPVALTLLRGPRHSMSIHSPETPADLRNAGRFCLGIHEVCYAVMPHSGDWQEGELYRRYSEYRNQPEIIQFQPETANEAGAAESSFLNISPQDIVMSCLKKAEDRDTVILRVFNPRDTDIPARITFKRTGIRNAFLVRLDEQRVQEIDVEKPDTIAYTIAAKKIVTFEIEPGE